MSLNLRYKLKNWICRLNQRNMWHRKQTSLNMLAQMRKSSQNLIGCAVITRERLKGKLYTYNSKSCKLHKRSHKPTHLGKELLRSLLSREGLIQVKNPKRES